MDWRGFQSRPGYKATAPGQPGIGTGAAGASAWPDGYGWNWDGTSDANRLHAGEPIEPIPYMGNLDLYRDMAEEEGGSVTFSDPLAGNARRTIEMEYLGPDGVKGTSDDNQPLVITGTSASPIIINGPVVVPGDVLIKGVVQGKGTIYSGRNVHIIGEVAYKRAPEWRALERDTRSGTIRERSWTYHGQNGNLGKVDDLGNYTPP